MKSLDTSKQYTVSYAGAEYSFLGSNENIESFEGHLKTSGKGAQITFTKKSTNDGKNKFAIVKDGAGAADETVVPGPTHTGTVKIEKSEYINPASGDVKITVTDLDLNVTAGANNDTASAFIKGTNGVSLPITLAEDATVEGKFVYTLTSEVALLGEGTITVEYTDEKDNAGKSVVIKDSTNFIKIAGVVTNPALKTKFEAEKTDTAAKYVSGDISSTFGATAEFKLDIDASGNPVTVALNGLSTAKQVADAINTAWGTDVAKVDGKQVVIESTTKTSSSQIDISGVTDAPQFTAVTVNGDDAAPAVKAEYTFSVTTVPGAGEKVQVAGKTYAATGATKEDYAKSLATLIAADSSNEFTATADNSGVITLTQRTAAATTTPVVKIVK